MSEFKALKDGMQSQFKEMADNNKFLFSTDVSGDDLWELYLESFPEGTNPIYETRREYDCSACRQFIRNWGNVVTIEANKLVSIWDFKVGNELQVVVDALSAFVKSKNVINVFLSTESKLGTDCNRQILENGDVIKWQHFYFNLPKKFINRSADSIGKKLADYRANKDVFKRSLEEISIDAIEIVNELIDQGSIYRGAEHTKTVKSLLDYKNKYDKLDPAEKDNYCWTTASIVGPAAKIKNTVIGTLLFDISSGTDLDAAVRMFESKVAPSNYKRPTALVTKSMIDKAQKKVQELGIEGSLSRRHANVNDVTINNVLFADRSVKKSMNVFDDLRDTVSDVPKNLKKIEEVGIEQFIKDILPKVDSIEMMFENKHQGNLMSLVAPIDSTAKGIFKWGNNFSWSYNGEVADSMKERVKKAGGNVDGVLRFSIQWNDGDDNKNDFDAHAIEPNGNLIYYPKKGEVQSSSGMLDVDIISPGNKVAVENITWTDVNRMKEGKYKFLVHNFNHRGGRTGFTAEIEYNGAIYSYCYDKNIPDGAKVVVAEIKFSRDKGIEFIQSLPLTTASKEIWNISTNKFHNVSMIMNSPNHWDGESTGNKHYFFILDKCKNDSTARGFFNEFLSEELTEHRKVFEVLGSKMKVQKSDDQLSGLGFSETQRNGIICKVTGSFTRMIKIIF